MNVANGRLKHCQWIDGWLTHHMVGYNMLSFYSTLESSTGIVNMITYHGVPHGEMNHIRYFSSMNVTPLV